VSPRHTTDAPNALFLTAALFGQFIKACLVSVTAARSSGKEHNVTDTDHWKEPFPAIHCTNHAGEM